MVNANSSLDVKALAGDSSFITNLAINNQFKDSVAKYSTDTAMLAGTGITINRSAAGNTISANGSMNITMQASNYTISSTDNVILVDASAGNVTVSVPAALAVKGRTYTIKRVDAVNANTVIIDFAGNHIDNGTDTQISVGTGVTYQIINFSSSQWYTISRF